MSRSNRSYPSNTAGNNEYSSPTPSMITSSSATLSPLQMQPTIEQPPESLPLIVPIDQKTVKRLVAGQAVMDLASIVKELVDNALDAGARSINIRLFNQGLDVVEVTDDGTGVPQASRELMAMKHATSKIRNFSDIYSGSERSTTLGFRGEALFCLANISQNLVVATRTADEEIGEKMEFNSMGFVRSGSLKLIPRKVGTTVAVVKPFDALPVRRADLVTRIKFYRTKLLKLIQGYGIFASGVRLNLIDIHGDVGRSASKTDYVLSTSERSVTIPERVSSVLGAQFAKGLCPINVDLTPLIKALTEKRQKERVFKEGRLGCINNELEGAYLGTPGARRMDDGSIFDTSSRSSTNVTVSKTTGHWRIEGVVSRSPVSNSKVTGQGFVARDLQFYCIGGRPVDMPRVSRVLTDVWKSVLDAAGLTLKGTRKRPACVLHFHIPNSMYDINLSPDKREVLISDETYVLDVLKAALVELWSSSSEGTFEENQVEKMSNKSEESRSFTRMERRNAFVNDPSTVGTAAPDSSYDRKGNKQVNDSGFGGGGGGGGATVKKGDTYPPQAEKPVALPPNAYAVGSESSSYSVSSAADVSSFSKITGQDNAPAVAEKDRRLWNQTKLQFNRTSKSEDDDPQRGAVGEVEQRSQRKATYDSNDCHYAAQDIPQAYEKYVTNTSRSKRARTNETSIPCLSQFAYGATGGNGINSKEMSTVVTSQDHGSQGGALGSSVGRGAHSKYEGAQMESQVSLSPPSTTDYEQPHESSRELYQQAYDSVPSMSTSQYGNESFQGAEKSAGPSTSIPSQQESVVWKSFRGTADVVRLSRSSRRRMRRTQRSLRRTQIANREKEKDQYSDSNISKTGMDESVGLTPYEGEANISLGKRKRSIHLTKDDFLEMEIVGQFNLGFILARCRNNHLWILDQHACDEKFNFERLCKTTVIHEQKLIAPLPLELSPSEEHTILENIEVFEQNGFRFSYNRDKPPRHRLALTALPHSGSGGDGKKAVQFGKEDVGALCSMLGADGNISSGYEGGGAGYGTGADGSGMHGNNAVKRLMAQNGSGLSSGSFVSSNRSSIVRLPKAIAMFASRACRGSIMVGTALSHKEMEDVVRKMHDVDEPWNCPHGRPTMRHVRGLHDCLFEDCRTALEHVAGPSLAVMSQDYET